MYKILVVERKSGLAIKNKEYLMQEAHLMTGARFEAVGIQDDGTPVVFDRCGNFGYLDSKKVKIVIEFEQT